MKHKNMKNSFMKFRKKPLIFQLQRNFVIYIYHWFQNPKQVSRVGMWALYYRYIGYRY